VSPVSPPPVDPHEADPSDAHELRIAVARLSRRIRTERVATDLGDSQMSVISLLGSHDSLTLTELSELERITPPSMTRTVSQLVDDGYIARTPSADDGRKVLLELTDQGREVAAETRRKRDAWFSHRLEVLTAKEREQLRAAVPVLRKLADS
jgi:DNA-binding MarR family transcriptional regulator